MKLYIESGESRPAAQVLDDAIPMPSGYVLVDTIEGWNRYALPVVGGFYAFRDYKKFRDELAVRVYTKTGFNPTDPTTFTLANWNLLSDIEKGIASRFFVVPDVFRDMVYSTEQQIEYGTAHHHSSVEARAARVLETLSVVYNRLALNDAREVSSDLNQIPVGTNIATDGSGNLTAPLEVKILLHTYEQQGIEGSLEDGVVGLFDYVLSRTSTPFDLTGLSTKAFAVKGMVDCAELATRVHDVLANGTY